MLKTVVVLPDGRELSSGAGTKTAIRSMTVTQCVNSGQELTLGACCAAMVELCIYDPQRLLTVQAGQELEIYRQTPKGVRHRVGIFRTEKPVRQTAGTLKLTAYDRIIRLDKDLSAWLAALKGWPYTLLELADMICDACSLKLKNTEIPNGGYPVRRFEGEGITGRQLMQWIAQASGRFCRATEEGELELAWYAPVEELAIAACQSDTGILFAQGELCLPGTDITVEAEQGDVRLSSDRLTATDDGQGNVTLTVETGAQIIPFFQNGLSFEDYETAPIEKVHIRDSREDVGTVYPDGLDEAVNTYVIEDNPLLTALTGEELKPVAEVLYEILRQVRYTPCKVAIPATVQLRPGDIVPITDSRGKTFTAWVMTKTQKGQKDTLECTGSPTRESSAAFNNRIVSSVQGKLLKLSMDVEGLRLENTDRAGALTRVEADLQGIRGQVSTQTAQLEHTQSQMSQLEQTAQGLQLTVEKLQSDGAGKLRTAMGYTFDDNGLQISREGQQMKNLLDNTGMYVTRDGQTVLQANDTGVTAADVRVRNYLIVGEYARFEDYTDGTDSRRTACFWLGG